MGGKPSLCPEYRTITVFFKLVHTAGSIGPALGQQSFRALTAGCLREESTNCPEVPC